jgi:hypothetical protein
MDNEFLELKKELVEQRLILEEIKSNTKSTKRYFQITGIITIILIVVPILISLFIIPTIMSSFSGLTSLGI